jgi:hypothetical protein
LHYSYLSFKLLLKFISEWKKNFLERKKQEEEAAAQKQSTTSSYTSRYGAAAKAAEVSTGNFHYGLG